MDVNFTERRAINVIVAYWRVSHNKSPDHVKPSSTVVDVINGCSIGHFFFMQVYRDLLSGSNGKYANFTELNFMQFLETEYQREEYVELGRKYKRYENICWNCHNRVSSDIHKRCAECGWFICNVCGCCKTDCINIYIDSSFPDIPDFPDFLPY